MPPNVDEAQPAAAGAEARGLQLLGSRGEHAVDLRREGGSLHSDLAVALDEHEQDVLAAQAGQQLVGRRVAIGVAAELGREDRSIVDVGLHRAHLGDGQVGCARGGDVRAGDELRTQRPEEHPDQAERRDGLERHPSMAGDDPVQAKHRERRQHERGDHRQRRPGEDQVRAGAADRLAQRLDPDVAIAPVLGGVERPVEGREEAVVEHLHDDQQADRRPHHPGQQAPGGSGQDEGQGDHDHTLERELHERTGCEEAGLVGSDECSPHEQEGEQREHARDGHTDGPMSAADASGGIPLRKPPPSGRPPPTGGSTATRRRGRTTRQAGRARRRGRRG